MLLPIAAGSAVSANGAYTWPAGVHSACGDISGTRYMTPGPVMAQYTAGQTITIQVAMTTEHMGRFSFRLCTDSQITNACFERASNYLTRCADCCAFRRMAICTHARAHSDTNVGVPTWKTHCVSTIIILCVLCLGEVGAVITAPLQCVILTLHVRCLVLCVMSPQLRVWRR